MREHFKNLTHVYRESAFHLSTSMWLTLVPNFWDSETPFYAIGQMASNEAIGVKKIDKESQLKSITKRIP